MNNNQTLDRQRNWPHFLQRGTHLPDATQSDVQFYIRIYYPRALLSDMAQHHSTQRVGTKISMSYFRRVASGSLTKIHAKPTFCSFPFLAFLTHHFKPVRFFYLAF